MYVFYSVCVR